MNSPVSQALTLAFIGGGNMATALATGLIGKRCGAQDVLVIDPNDDVRQRWEQLGTQSAPAPSPKLSQQRIWVFAVKPQVMKDVALACKPFLTPDTLIVSVAAGIPASAISRWFDGHQRIVRCMPNTPALIGAGISGLYALEGVSDEERAMTQQLLKAAGEIVWVRSDADIDAVTALSGSGPAYVFYILEALIEGGVAAGLTPETSRQLALATLRGATELAALSPEPPSVLRERVTSKGGTTAAALNVLNERQVACAIQEAMQAAKIRAHKLSQEFAA